jgi:phosphatidylglycerophosphate synthase
VRPAAGRRAALALTTVRVALAPVILWITRDRHAGGLYVACCTVAFLSDVFDGVIARRAGADTAAIRRYDSLADTAFYLAAVVTVWHVHPEVVHAYWPWAVTVGALELLRYAVDLGKFHREASYHTWSAKAWGVSLFVALVAVMGFGAASPWVLVAACLGVVADLEGLAISLLLAEWRHDVPNALRAWRLR